MVSYAAIDFTKGPTLKGKMCTKLCQCHEDVAVLGQFCAKIITLKLRQRYEMNQCGLTIINFLRIFGTRSIKTRKNWPFTKTIILRGRAGYELIYITNEAVGRVGYYQLISGKSEKNNCFSKFSSNSLDYFV